ncbi:MAG: hypothetical protein IIW01_06830 [Thermoguttaceae bacterium]|nr:hypothetical protein [Thermoguttaceae bacterium]
MSGLKENQSAVQVDGDSANAQGGEAKNGARTSWRRWPRRVVERCFPSRLAARFASDFFWMTVASIAARIGALISMILVARILGNVVYGEFCLIRSTVNGFVVLADCHCLF